MTQELSLSSDSEDRGWLGFLTRGELEQSWREQDAANGGSPDESPFSRG